jgi:hypothetical protein
MQAAKISSAMIECLPTFSDGTVVPADGESDALGSGCHLGCRRSLGDASFAIHHPGYAGNLPNLDRQTAVMRAASGLTRSIDRHRPWCLSESQLTEVKRHPGSGCFSDAK